ncbi:MAG: hypothetical protein VYE42_02320, partial [Actinomycetota bacterium]|nr:hypothetical protein [Actinomycetota bacterium]
LTNVMGLIVGNVKVPASGQSAVENAITDTTTAAVSGASARSEKSLARYRARATMSSDDDSDY